MTTHLDQSPGHLSNGDAGQRAGQSQEQERPSHSGPISRLNKPLLAAAVLAAGVTLLHVVAGGGSIMDPVRESTLDEEVRLTSYAVWHFATFAMALSAAVLGAAAFAGRTAAVRPALWFIAALWVGFGVIFLGVAAGHGGGIDRYFVELGQWIILMPVGLLAAWGLRVDSRRSDAQPVGDHM